ncbi:hypothetical protein JHN62_09795 [Streptomyces sp. MBT54]|nr:hypothetical protein [Streptomyces sp. MBT54]
MNAVPPHGTTSRRDTWSAELLTNSERECTSAAADAEPALTDTPQVKRLTGAPAPS